MSGIHVLSDILKGGNKLEKTSTPKGKDVSDSPETVAAVFAAMLSGVMSSNVDSKGQNSKEGQESEEKQNIQSVQNPNGLGSMLGYGNFVFSNLFQPMLQSNLPAGKDANSGNDVSQGTDAMLNVVSLASDQVSAQSGMTTQILQGDKPPITELDKYRQVIANLLVALSGEITDASPEGNRLNSEGAGTIDVRQEMAKIVQGWMTVTDQDEKGELTTSGQVKVISGNSTVPSPDVSLISSEILGTKVSRQDIAKLVEGWMTAMDESTNNGFISRSNVTGGQAKGEEESAKAIQVGNEIKTNSAESLGTKVSRQDITKLVEGWMTATDEVANNGSISRGNVINSSSNQMMDRLVALFKDIPDSAAPLSKDSLSSLQSSETEVTRQDMAKLIQPLLEVLSTGISTGNPALNAKAATLLAALNPFLRQENEDSKTSQDVNRTLDAEDGINASDSKGSSKSFIKVLNGTNLDVVTTQAKDAILLESVQQKSAAMVQQENKTSKLFQGAFKEQIQKDDNLQPTEVAEVKDFKNQNLSVGIGAASTLVATNVADGKTNALPVWEQISTVFREQVTNRHLELKELDIQLHPADLGKIQIGMRWENGQVHFVVHASEAATGQLLQNQLSDLRQTLTNQGVNCGMLQMGQGGERRQNPHGDESQRTLNQNTQSDEDEDLISVSNYLPLGQDGINRLNVTA